jgi:cytoskeleton protein RodZ
VSPTAPAQEARSVAGARTVRLRFRGSSWVEIRDRSGKVLLSKLNEAGSEAEVSGRPPFSVVVGNAPDVTMLYDEREFPLEPHTRVAVARFTLE